MALTIALAGNPNCGKTTLFNKLTGASQRVGNWPGVTIDKKVGKIRGTDGAELVDTPGIYSLSPYSPEEIVTRNFLMEGNPDAVINIVDATNIERNLFLTLQILDTGIPTVVALNMMDAVRKNGGSIDAEALSKRLGCPVVPISALKNEGTKELVEAVVSAAQKGEAPSGLRFDDRIEELISKAETAISGKVPDGRKRWYAVKLVEKDPTVSEKLSEAAESLREDMAALEEEYADEMDSVISDGRYGMIGEIVAGTITKEQTDLETGTTSDKIDKIVTHRILGIPIFLGVLSIVFLGVIGFGDFTGIGTYLTDLLNGYIEDPIGTSVEEWCADNGVSEELTGLINSAFIGGVGAVIGFLPQMLVLFLVLCILEDIGYMARAAFVMDRVFRFFGLSGKSFIPILVGTGCGVPGIMATRTIENERDRRITAMSVTFIPCGAKLPIIALIAGALFGNNGFVALFSYVLGIVVILMSGIILKKWKSLSGEPAPFIMELPPYHLPSVITTIKGTLDRGWAFVKKAGTIILLASVFIWFLASYDTSFTYLGADATSDSILQSIGQGVCVIFQPLGWGDHWELTVGSVTGLIAKENLVGTLGTLFALDEVGEAGEEYWDIFAAYLTPAAGLAFLTFNLLCAPCFAAIGAMHRELGTWKSTGMAVAYQCLIAYAVSTIVYVVGSLIDGTTPETSGIILAILSAAAIVYLLVAKDPFLTRRREASKEAAPQ